MPIERFLLILARFHWVIVAFGSALLTSDLSLALGTAFACWLELSVLNVLMLTLCSNKTSSINALHNLHWWSCCLRCPEARCRFCLASFCNNTGTANLLNSATLSLTAFAQRLALLSSFCSIQLDVAYIAGSKNKHVNFLSRCRSEIIMTSCWNTALRLKLTPHDLWFAHPKVHLHSQDASFPFEIPSFSILGAAI